MSGDLCSDNERIPLPKSLRHKMDLCPILPIVCALESAKLSAHACAVCKSSRIWLQLARKLQADLMSKKAKMPGGRTSVKFKDDDCASML